MDRSQLADFLRTRREAMQPEDVGLPRGQRRRTGGLRREEVAGLCGMSADHYSRIEEQRGSPPPGGVLAATAPRPRRPPVLPGRSPRHAERGLRPRPAPDPGPPGAREPRRRPGAEAA